MAKMSCFGTLLAGGRKKHRKVAGAAKPGCNDCPKVKPVDEFVADAPVKVAAADTVPVVTHKGRDHLGHEAQPMGDDFEFEFHAAKKPVGSDGSGGDKGGFGATPEQDATTFPAEDPAEAPPRLKRSCSNIETNRPGPVAPTMPARRSLSYGDLTRVAETTTPLGAPEPEASPAASARTSRSADRVMLKKRSSSQVLPSRSRKLWWRLFLWSHRNPRPAAAAARSPAGRHGGYASDTHDEGPARRKDKEVLVDGGSPSPNPNQQWVAFCADSSLLDRVGAWVSSIENEPFYIPEEDGDDECPRGALELGEPSSAGKAHGGGKSVRRGGAAADEVVQANSVVQTLNAFSSVAHISGMGLKVVPMLAPFTSLRAVNLSSNFIVHIAPGSLPKGLHSLDLSRNKIAAIEGLRDLTKLRVLNLSYNRISRIGHGLSNCTAIRELYLAGNKISDVEGLHRLLKLTVLDLSFNKITTAKALGQLVANYHSLLALNLVGNPVQGNVGDEALRRAVTGLLPSLAYLNKQPVKPQRSAREVATDSVARAALGGGGGRSQRRRASRRIGSGSGDGSGRSRSKGRHHGLSSSSTKK